MKDLKLKCIKCARVYPFEINRHNCPKCNDIKFSNLFPVTTGPEPVYQKDQLPVKAGNTPCSRNEKIAAAFGVNNLFVKDESFNPYGTHKDRRSHCIVNMALELAVDKLVCLTAGNAGYSLSRFAYFAGIDYTSIAFAHFCSETRKRNLMEFGRLVMIDTEKKDFQGIMSYRDLIKIAEEYDFWERGLRWKNIWNVTNMFEPLSLTTYKQLFYEIKDAKPDYVVVPIGSGDLFVGIWLAIKELKMKTKLVGAAPKGASVFLPAFEQENNELVLKDYIRDYQSEKLVAPYSAMLPFTNKALLEGHEIKEFTPEDLEKARMICNKSGLRYENSAAAAFAVLPQLEAARDDKIVVVSTGRGLVEAEWKQ
jgi:threonine synthase